MREDERQRQRDLDFLCEESLKLQHRFVLSKKTTATKKKKKTPPLFTNDSPACLPQYCPHGLMAKAFASRATGARFKSRSRHTKDLNICESWGSPAGRLTLLGQCSDWFAQCQYAVTGRRDSKFNTFLTR